MKLPERGHLRELTREECLERLASASVGRLGVTIRALPVILPVNFVVHEGSVYIRSVPGSKLTAATSGAVVAFEADAWDPDGTWGWSVLVQAIPHEIENAEKAALRAAGLQAWAFPSGEADHFLRIEPELISGREFRRSAGFRY